MGGEVWVGKGVKAVGEAEGKGGRDRLVDRGRVDKLHVNSLLYRTRSTHRRGAVLVLQSHRLLHSGARHTTTTNLGIGIHHTTLHWLYPKLS